MSTVRTLPIRVTPTDGEAIDSWLEATAHRVRTAFGDLLTAVGLSPYNGIGTTAWIVRLNPDEVATISTATGIMPDVLNTMTLQHYSGRAVRIEEPRRVGDTRHALRGRLQAHEPDGGEHREAVHGLRVRAAAEPRRKGLDNVRGHKGLQQAALVALSGGEDGRRTAYELRLDELPPVQLFVPERC